MAEPNGPLRQARAFYAALLSAAASSADPRLRRAFANIRREAFLSPGPWKVYVPGGHPGHVATPSADPIHLYQDILIVLDAARGINNGQPSLHARWLAAIAPQPGEAVIQIGAGGGYYTAILATLVGPGGTVAAFEIDAALAAAAAANLRPYENVTVVAASAMAGTLPPADIVYVNAGAAAPHEAWLSALRPGGRLILPWRPTAEIGVSVIITRAAGGFSVRPLGRAFFIPCEGATDFPVVGPVPDLAAVLASRSLHLSADGLPDATATVVYDHLWFSSAP